MKRVWVLFVVLALTVGLLMLPAQAADSNSQLFVEGFQNYYASTELLDAYFPAGMIPKEIVLRDLRWACNENGALSSYFTYTRHPEYDFVTGGTAQIPGDVVEALAGAHFTDQDAVNAFLRAHTAETEGAEIVYKDGTYHFNINFLGGFGGYIPLYHYLGYQDLGNGSFAVYCHRADTEIDDVPYVPAEGETEGVDYVLVSVLYPDRTEVVYGKICDQGVKAVMTMKDGTYAFTSMELISRNDIPSNLSDAPEAAVIQSWADDIFLRADPKIVGVSVHFAIESITDEANIALLDEALQDGTTVVSAWELNALDPQFQRIPDFQGPVELRLTIPDDCQNPAVFYISPEGTAEEIPGRVEDGAYVCTLSHFSTYVLTATEDAQAPVEPNPTEDSTTTQPTAPTSPTGADTAAPAPTNFTWLWILLAVLAVAGFVGGFLAAKFKKN